MNILVYSIYTILKIPKLVNDVKIPPSLSNWINSQFTEESVKVLFKSTQQCFYVQCLSLEGGQCKSNPELAREKRRIETMNLWFEFFHPLISAICTYVTSLLLGMWDSGAENPWKWEQEEDSLVSALLPMPSLAYGLKCMENLVGLHWTGLYRESSQITQHIKWLLMIFCN